MRLRLEHKAGTDIIYELSVRLYPSPFESFREAISNAFDEGSKKVAIRTSVKEIIVEDWGEGIKDVEKFATFGEAAKAKLGGEIIGEKGLGKLSLLRLGKNVNFRTNNDEYGISIVMTPEYLDYEIGKVNKYLDHTGTQIVIPNPEIVPPTDELANYLKKAFGLRLANDFEIILNGAKLESRAKIDADEHLVCRLKGGVDVTGNIKEEKKGRGVLDVYVKHVFVTTILVDPERRFGGWINCNRLTPTTARNDIVKDNDGIYEEFLHHLRQYVSRFPKVEEEVSRDEVLIGNELDKMLRSYLKDMKILPEGKLLSGRGKEPTLNRQNRSSPTEEAEESEKEPEYIKTHRNPKTNKPIKRTTKTNYGIIWLDQDYGNEREPIFFVEPNIIVKNRTNNLYKFALRNKPSLGPKWLRLVPYLSRIAVTMNPESAKWTREQMFQRMDEAIRYFLRQKDEL